MSPSQYRRSLIAHRHYQPHMVGLLWLVHQPCTAPVLLNQSCPSKPFNDSHPFAALKPEVDPERVVGKYQRLTPHESPKTGP